MKNRRERRQYQYASNDYSEYMSTHIQADEARTTEREKLAPPPLYKVLLLNDDFTPMEFVVQVLQQIFHMDRERATQTMLKVHTEGRAVCGIYPRDIAETKVEQVGEFARASQHPLQCVIEVNE